MQATDYLLLLGLSEFFLRVGIDAFCQILKLAKKSIHKLGIFIFRDGTSSSRLYLVLY